MRPCILDPYAEQWKEGIWSVEFKQPQLQIARHYTPLPPVLSPIENQHGALRFLIRTEKGGEMSNYLAMLAAGDKLELRGPHSSLKLPKHLADVVFLAGGTGIAPAMQAAYTLLENQSAEYSSQLNIHIVWANRRREDCAGGGESLDESNVYSTATTGKLVRELWALQERHPKNLRIDYLVDEEKTILNQKRVSSLLRRDTQVSSPAFHPSIDSKLIIVSGPEGFVNYLAGPKKWWEGKELQGDLDGMLGHLGVRDWKVWKL
ncbi:hypothetical protein B0O99DRAFT_656994 [Bisporella sp. PMI_857]|nr:hypothetical protein B0O99DRAFT_656994 [Bisporella sp. PMI_857]